MKVRITEYLDVDLEKENWFCNKCGHELGSAKESYKKGCRIYERNPTKIYRPIVKAEYNFAPDPDWCRFIEFYCPNCGVMFEVEVLPPGHPLTNDIELDLEQLKRKHLKEKD
jgi:acetophenone carboxylase